MHRLITNPASDFYEGVRAQLVDKDRKPMWSHASIEDVRASAVDVGSYFAELDPSEELSLSVEKATGNRMEKLE